ncbi:MAG TPA: ABC transporter permease [Chloroflexia bacterium]|nr:ABC transporter permease [Chloroflexia bacterium]
MATTSSTTDQPVSSPTEPPEETRGSNPFAFWQQSVRSLLVPALAIFTALVLSGIVIWLSTGDLSKVIGPEGAFAGLWQGAVGTPKNIAGTLMTSTPYIFAGLAVALAFKCGLFNIGAEGQLAAGALATAFAGYTFKGLPFPMHLILALAAGLAAGLAWGAIPGALKAFRGAHEVIITIMLNYIALQVAQFLLGGPMKDRSGGNVIARTPAIAKEAEMPLLFPGTPWQMHWGVVLALVAAGLVYLFLTRTTWGFEIRTVGANPHAARYAGMSVAKSTVLAMALSGMLAGAAGATEVVGVTHRHELGFGSGYGFDSIAIALLGRSHPFGVVAAALLFGGLKSGATQMQFNTQISGSIISVVQGLVLLFVAADMIIIWLFRLRPRMRPPTLALAPAAAAAESGTVISPVADPLIGTTRMTETYPVAAPAEVEDAPVFTGNKGGDEERTRGAP